MAWHLAVEGQVLLDVQQVLGHQAHGQVLKARKPGAPNPLVLGTEGYGRYFTVWHECARANMDRYKANLLIYGPDPRTWPPEINATTAASARLGVRPAGE